MHFLTPDELISVFFLHFFSFTALLTPYKQLQLFGQPVVSTRVDSSLLPPRNVFSTAAAHRLSSNFTAMPAPKLASCVLL